MNICINGVTRPMTAEEEAKFLAERDSMPAPWETDELATESDYIEALQDLGVSLDE